MCLSEVYNVFPGEPALDPIQKSHASHTTHCWG